MRRVQPGPHGSKVNMVNSLPTSWGGPTSVILTFQRIRAVVGNLQWRRKCVVEHVAWIELSDEKLLVYLIEEIFSDRLCDRSLAFSVIDRELSAGIRLARATDGVDVFRQLRHDEAWLKLRTPTGERSIQRWQINGALRLVTIARFTGDRWTAGDPARHPSTIRAAATADGNVAERAAHGPVPPAGLAEVARLAQAVVVVVAELGVAGAAARAPWGELDVGFRPPVRTGRQAMARRRHRWMGRRKQRKEGTSSLRGVGD
ncbi:hypothetical protein BHM03_00014726 [Ensete ventricosum]|nr:hypothetical protein BHM03_00014726 [Ensete ventricosum]